MNQTGKFSPQQYARVAGILYLTIIIVGFFAELFVRGKLIDPGDAAVTANNIAANQQLWRTGVAADLLMHLCDVPVMLIIYVLLKPINKNLALMAVLFNVVQTAVLVANKLNLLHGLFFLTDAAYLKAFTTGQLQALAYTYIKAHDYGYGIGLLFFGFTCIINGYLIRKSDYLPKLIGVLVQIAGCCYLTNSFLLIIKPDWANTLFMLPSFIAELSFCLWLLIKGVNMNKWNERFA